MHLQVKLHPRFHAMLGVCPVFYVYKNSGTACKFSVVQLELICVIRVARHAISSAIQFEPGCVSLYRAICYTQTEPSFILSSDYFLYPGKTVFGTQKCALRSSCVGRWSNTKYVRLSWFENSSTKHRQPIVDMYDANYPHHNCPHYRHVSEMLLDIELKKNSLCSSRITVRCNGVVSCCKPA